MQQKSSDQSNNPRQSKINIGVAIAIGVGIGIAMKNLTIGLAIGLVIYFVLNRTKGVQKNKGGPGSEDKS